MGGEVRVRVLGPVEVQVNETLVPLTRVQRVLLAALAVDVSRVVPTDTLLERLAPERRGAGALTTLHSYVSRLRRQLEPTPDTAGWSVLRTQAPGYRLDLPEGALDAEAFRSSVRLARAHQEPARAREAVRRALDAWRGTAYADLVQPFAVAESARLEEQWLEARELAAELDLTLGRHREILDDLAELVRREPLRESLRGSLMTALYRSGRQAAALQAYDEGRHLLAEELGVDPGPDLRRLHEQVLRHDPDLDAPARSSSAVVTTAPSGSPDPEPEPEPEPESDRPYAAFESHASGIGRAALVLPPTSFVGRDDELRELVALLGSGARLVTLIGTGGVGKTRVALTLADRIQDDFPDGVVLVPLATLQDPGLVVPTIARALGIGVSEGPRALDDLAAQLGDRRVLLVLDNAEHLLDAAADLAWLVGACPSLVLLVTSRAPLRVSGEQERLVEPLLVGASTTAGAGGLEAAEASPAVRLFVERARSVAHRFRLDATNAGTVVEICRRLGGIPLALELAAARLRVFGPEVLLLRLDEALLSGPRDLPPRQRTMQATLDWSYQLLDDDARRLFRRLSVFSGGWTLPMLQAVEGEVVLDPLETLVEHSLVAVTWSRGEPRYSMLEPISQHARRLVGPDEHDSVARVHAAAYVELAERAAQGYLVGDQLDWLEVTDFEHANLLSAFEWTLNHGEHDTAARIVWALWLYWWLRSYTAVGRRAATAVAASPHLSPAVRIRATTSLAALSFGQGDHEAARASYEVALEQARLTADVEAEALTVAGLGIVALATGELVAAETHQRHAIELGEGLGPAPYGPWIVALGNVWLGTALLETGRREEALAHFDRGLALSRSTGDRLAGFVALWNLSRAELGRDDDAAHRHLVEGIRLSQEVADLANLSYFLDALVVVERRRTGEPAGAADRHAVVLGAAQALREAAGLRAISYYLPDEAAREEAAGQVLGVLGDDAYAARVAEGAVLSLDEAVRRALHEDRSEAS